MNKYQNEYINNLVRYIERIERQNKYYKQRIDKAIEYIKNKQEDINNGGNDMSYRQLTTLLEILGDKENEWRRCMII